MLRTIRERISVSQTVRLVLVGGFLLMLAANLPGHLSTDSILQLYEGRMEVRETFGPVVYARILGILDHIVPGAGLYVVASGLLLTASLLSLRDLRPRTSLLAIPIAAFVVLSPTVLVYQGIVWKDVLFANLAVAGFAALARAARRWNDHGVRWLALATALLLMAVAMSIRQNGVVAPVLGAMVLAWTARAGGWKAMAAYGVGGLAAVVVVAQALGVVAQPASAGPDKAVGVGLRILQHYDIIGAVAHDPTLKLEAIDAANPAADDLLRADAAKVYSPERVDFVDRIPEVGKTLWPLPAEAISAEWRDLILHHPTAYLGHRWDAFCWVFLTPVIEKCVPVHVGVSGPPEKLAALRLTAEADPADAAVFGYAARFFHTPLYSHLSYAIIAVAVFGLLMLRRDPADMVVAALQVAALGFAASFFVISLACDYRYLYFLDLAALTGLLYVALDPPRLSVAKRRA